MSAKPKDLKRAHAYLPAPIYDLLQKRANDNFNSMNNEMVQIISKFFQQEQREQQEQTKEAALS